MGSLVLGWSGMQTVAGRRDAWMVLDNEAATMTLIQVLSSSEQLGSTSDVGSCHARDSCDCGISA